MTMKKMLKFSRHVALAVTEKL